MRQGMYVWTEQCAYSTYRVYVPSRSRSVTAVLPCPGPPSSPSASSTCTGKLRLQREPRSWGEQAREGGFWFCWSSGVHEPGENDDKDGACRLVTQWPAQGGGRTNLTLPYLGSLPRVRIGRPRLISSDICYIYYAESTYHEAHGRRDQRLPSSWGWDCWGQGSSQEDMPDNNSSSKLTYIFLVSKMGVSCISLLLLLLTRRRNPACLFLPQPVSISLMWSRRLHDGMYVGEGGDTGYIRVHRRFPLVETAVSVFFGLSIVRLSSGIGLGGGPRKSCLPFGGRA